ncbi:hypothetical protein Tco_0653588 [Tanacetum coccineum]|uniref:Reverse transcriptase domain-containing protein n=1 Tax=Tanacetum coccineum TaxID=301880 RepID=A0ABQ4X0V2_9ASTR
MGGCHVCKMMWKLVNTRWGELEEMGEGFREVGFVRVFGGKNSFENRNWTFTLGFLLGFCDPNNVEGPKGYFSLFASSSKGKLKTRWSGPFTITKVFPYGTIELSQSDGPNFKVNGHRVKHYFGGDLPPKVVQDLHTFPKDE